MWLFTYKKYKTSKVATILSVAGLMLRFAGLVILCGLNFITAAACAAAGCACHYIAEHLHFVQWVKIVRRDGLEEKIKCGDLATAGQLYKIFPSQKTVRYIASQNADVGQRLRQIIDQVKVGDKK